MSDDLVARLRVCTCHDAYKARGLSDPTCQFHSGDHAEAADRLAAQAEDLARLRERIDSIEPVAAPCHLDRCQYGALTAERDAALARAEALADRGTLQALKDANDRAEAAERSLAEERYAHGHTLKQRDGLHADLTAERERTEWWSAKAHEAEAALAAEREAIRDRSCGTCAHVLVRPGHGDFGDWLRCWCEFAPSYLADVTYTECCRSWSRKRKGEDA